MSRRKEGRDSTFELDLAPMLALMVSIIPLLLLNANFAKMTVVESPVPQVVMNPTHAVTSVGKPPEVNIYLYASKDEGLRFVLKKEKSEETVRIPSHDGKLDLVKLHEQALRLKQRYPDVFRLEFNPSSDVIFDQVIAVMDQIRNRAKADPRIEVKDPESGKMTPTDLLFPDVVLANVVEG